MQVLAGVALLVRAVPGPTAEGAAGPGTAGLFAAAGEPGFTVRGGGRLAAVDAGRHGHAPASGLDIGARERRRP